MLRIALWKLRATYSARLSRLRWKEREQRVYYFAFGANVHPKVMQRRRIRTYSEQALALAGYRLSFAQPGPWKNCGFATVTEDPGGVVWGKLYLISTSDARRLEYEELVPVFRRHRKLELEQEGRRFFLFQAVNPRTGLKPTRVYIDYIVGGLDGYPAVPREYVDALRTLETARAGAISDTSGYLIRGISEYPRLIQPAMRLYERLGAWTLSKL